MVPRKAFGARRACSRVEPNWVTRGPSPIRILVSCFSRSSLAFPIGWQGEALHGGGFDGSLGLHDDAFLFFQPLLGQNCDAGLLFEIAPPPEALKVDHSTDRLLHRVQVLVLLGDFTAEGGHDVRRLPVDVATNPPQEAACGQRDAEPDAWVPPLELIKASTNAPIVHVPRDHDPCELGLS